MKLESAARFGNTVSRILVSGLRMHLVSGLRMVCFNLEAGSSYVKRFGVRFAHGLF